MRVEFTKEQLLEVWIETSEKIVKCLTEKQMDDIPALLDLREKILNQFQLTKTSGNITKELCSRADKVEKEVHRKMDSKVNELRQALQASNRQRQINTYDPYEKDDVNSILNFYK